MKRSLVLWLSAMVACSRPLPDPAVIVTPASSPATPTLSNQAASPATSGAKAQATAAQPATPTAAQGNKLAAPVPLNWGVDFDCANPAKATGVCGVVQQQFKNTICEKRFVPDGGAGGLRTTDLAKCWPDAAGGWVVMPDGLLTFSSKLDQLADADEIPFGEVAGRYFVARLDNAGKIAKRLRGVAFSASMVESFSLSGVSFDYDADGANELEVLSHSGDHSGGSGTSRGSVWTYRGRMEELRTPLPVVSVEDFDNDGRPDLLANGPYSGSLVELPTCGTSLSDASGQGPYLLMHSLSGVTFSVEDPTARNYAQSSCNDIGDVSQLDSESVCSCHALPIIRCERLRGVPAERLMKAVQSACASCDACPLANQMNAWARVKPPLLLK